MAWSRREAIRIHQNVMSWALGLSISTTLIHGCFIRHLRDIKIFPKFNVFCAVMIYAGYFLYPKPEARYYKLISE